VYEDVPVDGDPELTEVAKKTPPFGGSMVDDILLPGALAKALSGSVEADVAAASTAVTVASDTVVVSSIVWVA
jgi:hypothetical protein